MNGLEFILHAGPKHSKRNAEKISVWLKGEGAHHVKHADALVEEWAQKHYLSKADAETVRREIPR